MDEEELIRVLMKRRRMLLAYIRSIVLSPELAEDLFQDSIVIALKKAKELDIIHEPSAWFRKIARFQALNAIRKKRADHLDPTVLDLLDEVWNQRGKESDDKSVRLDGLRECVRQLPDKIRQIVHMRYNKGMSSQEVADEKSVPLNTVYVYVSRAHRMLRECISRDVRLQANPGGEL